MGPRSFPSMPIGAPKRVGAESRIRLGSHRLKGVGRDPPPWWQPFELHVGLMKLGRQEAWS
jgi:hypothetical protein